MLLDFYHCRNTSDKGGERVSESEEEAREDGDNRRYEATNRQSSYSLDFCRTIPHRQRDQQTQVSVSLAGVGLC